MPDTCGRCGAPLVSLADLAEAALVALDGLHRRKLAMPDCVPRSVVLLASALPCHAGLCARKTEP